MSWWKHYRDIPYGSKYDLAVGYINEIRAEKHVIRVLINSMELNKLYNVYMNKKSYVLAHYEPDDRIKTGAIVLVKRKPLKDTIYEQKFHMEGLLDDYNSLIDTKLSAKDGKSLENLTADKIYSPIRFPTTPKWLITKVVDIRPEFYKNNQVNFFLLKILEETADEISHNYAPPKYSRETSIVSDTSTHAPDEMF